MTTTQAPLGSGFGAASTADDVVAGIDLTGKTAIVTGGAPESACPQCGRCAPPGAMVVVPARNVDAAAETLAGLDVEIRAMDLMVPKTIDVFAARFLASGRPLHLLVNNGGIGGAPLAATNGATSRCSRRTTSATSTSPAGCGPRCAPPKGARVVAVSSWAHRGSPVVLDDLMFERRDYDPVLRMGSRRQRTSSTRSPSTSVDATRTSARSPSSGHDRRQQLQAVHAARGAHRVRARRRERRRRHRSVEVTEDRRTRSGDERVVRDEPEARWPRWPVCTGL